MGHLITVQNLLRLLDASPHLDRDELLPKSGKEPAPFLLEPITPESLAKYTVIESPLDEVIRGTPAWVTYERARATINAKSLTQLNRVGLLYAAIYWLFMKTDHPQAGEPWPLDPGEVLRGKNTNLKGVHLKDDDFLPAQQISAFIAKADEWGLDPNGAVYVEPTLDRESAKRALYKISSQGEGISSDPLSVSHFQRFLELFATAEKQPPDVLRVPMMKSGDIGTKAGQQIAECFNTRYQMLCC
jgi:hypothetical protein